LQGGEILRPLVGAEIALAAVDGKIYQSIWPFTTFTQIPELQFSPSAGQIFFEQATQSAERISADLGSAVRLIPSRNVMMIQDGQESAPGWFDGANAGHIRGSEFGTPSGGPMKWVGDRLWVAFDDQLVASDPSNPFSFRENTYLGGQSSFRFSGTVTALAKTPASDAPQLMVFTQANGSLIQANIRDRSLWPTTLNFQEEVVQVGCWSHRSVISHFGKMFWMSPAGVAFFDPTTAGRLTTRLPTRDVEMLEDKIRLNDDLTYAATGKFGQFLMMSLPSEDTFNRTTWVINNASFTSMSDDSGPCWNGYWMGTRPVQWMCGQVSGAERAFHVAHDEDGKNRLWETFQSNRLDNGCPITWALFTRGYFGQTAAVQAKPPGSKCRLKWVDIAVSALEEDLDLGAFYAGGMSGAFTPFLVTKLNSEKGSLSFDLSLDAETQIFSFKPQSRTVRTQDADEQTHTEDGACPVEKDDLDNIDTNFQLLLAGHGPVTIRWIRPVSIMNNEDLSGNPKACEDETGKRAVRYDGEAAKADTDAELVEILSRAPENLYTAVDTATLEQNGFVATGAGVAESIVSQRAADRVAKIIAVKFAEQELSAVQPPFYSIGLGLDTPIFTPPPVIVDQPDSQTVFPGVSVLLVVAATGPGPISYQWVKNSVVIPGAVFPTFEIDNAGFSDSGAYTVVVTNPGGSVTSAPANFLVVPVLPSIVVQPVGASIVEHQNVTFSVTAAGTEPLLYQWQFNGANIPGATGSSFSIVGAAFSDIGNYQVIVSNMGGTVTSNSVHLAVAAAGVAPTITSQPSGQTVTEGASVTFTVIATGTAPLAYQWKKNGGDIGGATSSTLTFPSTLTTDSADYTVVVSNAFGSVTSAIATLLVNQSAGTIVANAWSAQVVTNGGAAPGATSLAAVKTFWNSIVAAGIDSKMIAVNIVAPDSVIAALTPIYKTSGNSIWTNTGFVGGDLSVNGLIGDGGGKFAATGLTPGFIWTANDAGMSVYVHTAGSGNSVSMGAFESGSVWAKISGAASGLKDGFLFGSTAEPFEVGTLTGFMTVNRTAAAVIRLDTAKSSLAYATRSTSAAANGTPGFARAMYAWAQNTGSANNHTTERISFLAAHRSLSLSEGQAFYNAVQALRTALGGGFV
jgi:hypothetical protein